VVFGDPEKARNLTPTTKWRKGIRPYAGGRWSGPFGGRDRCGDEAGQPGEDPGDAPGAGKAGSPAGGSDHGGIVLLMDRMNRILEIDRENMMITVEPGGDQRRSTRC